MIRGVHAMFYASDAEALRTFIRDKLQFPHTDVGHGWLIFDLPEADLGVHPSGEGAGPGTHDISFYCDDLDATITELKSRGVEFVGDVTEAGFGRVTRFRMPGGVEAQLYQPRYVKQPAAR